MDTDKHDWRLQLSNESLRGATLFRRRYQAHSETWDHDHCEFCQAKFMEDPSEGTQLAGYCDASARSWICDKCFADFQTLFDWKTAPFNDEQIKQAIEAVIASEFPIDPERFELTVHSTQAGNWRDGQLSIEATVTVTFLVGGSPYCCGEPVCHLRLFSLRGEERLSQVVSEQLRLKHSLSIRLNEQSKYADGVRFRKL